MAKGLFTQGMCVLLDAPVQIDAVRELLTEFEILSQHEAGEGDATAPTLVLQFRPEVEGRALVTISDSPWPDEMGDPEEAPEMFVAWSLGQYGPLAFPGCLQRAAEQAWAWEEGREIAGKHRAHIRVLISYVLGSDDDTDDAEAPLLPEDYEPLDELHFVTRIVTQLLALPQALCYFNPGGEVIRDDEGLREGLNYAWSHELPPLDMWTNVRLFKASEEWSLMDTVGNGQLDLPDLEAVYRADDYDPTDVESFLRNASLYLLREGDEVEDGDTADGPGDTTWHALECDDGLADPPRPTIRWFPDDGSQPPEELLYVGVEDEDDDTDAEEPEQ